MAVGKQLAASAPKLPALRDVAFSAYNKKEHDSDGGTAGRPRRRGGGAWAPLQRVREAARTALGAEGNERLQLHFGDSAVGEATAAGTRGDRRAWLLARLHISAAELEVEDLFSLEDEEAKEAGA